jgi:thiol-disulfide isomerase/thioredoxin
MPIALPPPVLEVFYAPTCAPCRLELPVLTQIVEKRNMRVRIILIDDAPALKAGAIGIATGPLGSDAAPASDRPSEA